MGYSKINNITTATWSKINNVAKAALDKIIDTAGVFVSSWAGNSKSLDFDGTNDTAISASNIDVDVMNRRTKSISFWFQSSNISGHQHLFCFGANVMTVSVIGNNLYIYHALTHALSDLKPHWSHRTKWYNTGAWVNLTFTISTPGGNGTASVGKVYIDAVEVISATHSQTQSDYPAAKVSAGAQNNGYNFWASKIDEIGWWDNVALSPAEVTAIYNSGAPLDLSVDSGNYSSSSSLAHWWRMGDGDTYPIIQDKVGSLDLTMTNMVAGDIVTDVP